MKIKKLVSAEITTNTGHGHVFKRPDGVKVRCGGPGLCSDCSKDLAKLQQFLKKEVGGND